MKVGQFEDPCVCCGEELVNHRVLPLKSFSKDGVFAVDSVMRCDCLNPDCESGGGYEAWTAMGKLADLAAAIPERPLYAKHNPETNEWERVPPPEES